MGALESLASDTAISTNQDPDYLLIKALLTSSLYIQFKGLHQAQNELDQDCKWLSRLLKVNRTNKG